MRKQYKFIKHSKTDRYKELINKTMLNIAAFNVDIYGILRNFIEFILLLCFPNLLCCARKFGKGVVLLNSLELAQCRLTVLYRLLFSLLLSVLPFLAALRFLICKFCFSFYCFAFLVRLRWGISLLRERPRALPFGFPQAFEKA